MPVRFRNQVNTTPSPQIVVKKERNETNSAALLQHDQFSEDGIMVGGLTRVPGSELLYDLPSQRYGERDLLSLGIVTCGSWHRSRSW